MIPRLWPKISWAFGIGTGGFATYTEKFRKYAGEALPIDFFVYAASEGMLAACVDMNDPRFVPLLDSCFFEFIPADAPEDCRETLLVDQLEEGREYEVVVTNQCGFYRYRIRDVIRVVGMYHRCPMIAFACRKSRLVNVAAEKTTEERLTGTYMAENNANAAWAILFRRIRRAREQYAQAYTAVPDTVMSKAEGPDTIRADAGKTTAATSKTSGFEKPDRIKALFYRAFRSKVLY